MSEVADILEMLGLLPVIELETATDAVALGKALQIGDLPLAEVTFRTGAAPEAIRILRDSFPDMIVGAGTILSISQAEQALKSGAQFIVSPGIDLSILFWCLEHNLVHFPGVVTPSEIMLALKNGLRILKFFPSEVYGGVKALIAISAPFREVRFIPTGGIDQTNLRDYLSIPCVIACGGSWIVNKKLIRAGNFSEIARLVSEARAIARQIRGRK